MNYTNSSSLVSPHPPVFPLDYRIVATALHSFLLVVGLVGNVVVMLVVHRTRVMHVPTYCYLVSLAVADFITLAAAVPEALISYHLYAHQWIFGQAGCTVLVFLSFMAINASSLSILACTAERFVVICKPLHARRINTFQRATRAVVGLWIVSFLTACPWLGLTITRSHPFYREFELCVFRFSPDKYRYIFGADFAIFYLIPLGISFFMHVRMNLALRQQMKQKIGFIQRTLSTIRRNISSSKMSSDRLPTVTDEPSLLESMNAASIVSTTHLRMQVARMLFTVMALFAILWLPYRAVSLYNSFAPRPILNKWFMLFAKTCIFFNASANPILYAAMCTRFRDAALSILLCRNIVRSSDF